MDPSFAMLSETFPEVGLAPKQSKTRPGDSIHAGIRYGSIFFHGENQVFSDVHLPSGPDADAHIGSRFADDPAWHGDVAFADNNEQNH
jgi:hypothetical protein